MTDHDHDHDRTVAPMVDEVTDFEVLEIAVRELCIEKGLFTADDHRRFTERRRIVRWPRQVLAEFGLYLPEDVAIRVEDSNQKHRFMVMPFRPKGTEDWDEDQLAAIVTRDCLIGVALPKVGVTTNAITTSVRPFIQ